MAPIVRYDEDVIEEARDLIDIANEHYDCGDLPLAAQCAHDAIRLWPDAADAYQLLGIMSTEASERRSYFSKARASGMKQIPTWAWETGSGYQFWGDVDSRPYMRAEHAYALELWSMGERTEAIKRFEALLRLCPNDNLGIRYPLVTWYLIVGRYSDARFFAPTWEAMRREAGWQIESYDDPILDIAASLAEACQIVEGAGRTGFPRFHLAHQALTAHPFEMLALLSGLTPDEVDALKVPGGLGSCVETLIPFVRERPDVIAVVQADCYPVISWLSRLSEAAETASRTPFRRESRKS